MSYRSANFLWSTFGPGVPVSQSLSIRFLLGTDLDLESLLFMVDIKEQTSVKSSVTFASTSFSPERYSARAELLPLEFPTGASFRDHGLLNRCQGNDG